MRNDDSQKQSPSRGQQKEKNTDSNKTEKARDPGADLHTETVMDAVWHFQRAGVLRSPASIARWLKKDAHGYSRLDSIYDRVQRKHFMTLLSIQSVISEEKAKESKRKIISIDKVLEQTKDALEDEPGRIDELEDFTDQIKNLQAKNFELTASNKAYEMFINKQSEQITSFADRIESLARTTGILETKLKQLEAPKKDNEKNTLFVEGQASAEAGQSKINEPLSQEEQSIKVETENSSETD